MNKIPVTAIFDIGKTNKKFFLFDENYREVFKEYTCFDEITDDDGYPADNLIAIEHWIKSLLKVALEDGRFNVRSINFSTYGATFVHVDENGVPVTPLYNYLKPYPGKILQAFYNTYGDEMKIALETASPPSGMLNSGLQLYWLKYAKPEIFKKIKYSLHFPQYLGYLFSAIPVSEYSSIGCHTNLWDYQKNDYHAWVYAEELNKILPPVVPANTVFDITFEEKVLAVGSGIHDSSASLLPYMLSDEGPFLLISTGTWSISLNPFSTEMLTKNDLENDCLNYMRTDGKAVKASRLLLGSEYTRQVNELSTYFNKEKDYHKTVQFDKTVFQKLHEGHTSYICFEKSSGATDKNDQTDYQQFENFEEAYHRMMLELVKFQAQSARNAIGNTAIKKIYIDGGFADNDIYVKILGHNFTKFTIYTTQSPLGSALGAAMIIADKKGGANFLKEHYSMKKHLI